MKQILPEKDDKGIVTETHVYSGPKGEGVINYEYRMNGEVLEVRAEHTGPENRNVPKTWTEIPDTIQTERVEVGSHEEDVDEVIKTIGVGGKEKEIVARKRVAITDYGNVQVTRKHPYKKRFYNVD